MCLPFSNLYSQFIYKIKADSVLITNDSCNAELNLENSTKNVSGFLFNKGNGRTEFRKGLVKVNDSVYVIGQDTLYVARDMSPVPISKLIAATGTNTINNANYLQEWQWNSLGGESGLKLSSTSTAASSNLQRILDVSLSGTNSTATQTTAAGYFSNAHAGGTSTNIAIEANSTGSGSTSTNIGLKATAAGSGGGSTNIALDASASGGTTNWAGRFTGNIHLNGTDPGFSFHTGTFGVTDNYIKRTGTSMQLHASGVIHNMVSGLDIYKFAHNIGHYWYTGTPTAMIRVVLKPNGHFIVGATVDSGALFQVNGGASINGSLALGSRSDGPTVSLLTMESTTKGFLRPRMTNTQRNAISSPSTGLSVYNTTLNTNDTYNGSEYFSFGNQIKIPATNTAVGTTGNQTINKVSGTVNIAATGTTVTVTNSLVTGSSIVLATLRTDDATAYVKNVVPGAGTFTINLGAAATAEVSVGFVVFN